MLLPSPRMSWGRQGRAFTQNARLESPHMVRQIQQCGKCPGEDPESAVEVRCGAMAGETAQVVCFVPRRKVLGAASRLGSHMSTCHVQIGGGMSMC